MENNKRGDPVTKNSNFTSNFVCSIKLEEITKSERARALTDFVIVSLYSLFENNFKYYLEWGK